MPSTPNFAIPYPDGATGFTPLQQKFADIANAVDGALTTGIGGAPRLANSDAERNAIYPTPVQGNAVNRPDKGWVEQYFAAYNATTNPAGATPSGWYPVSGATPLLSASRSNFTVNNGATVQFLSTGASIEQLSPGVSVSAAGVITITQPGFYVSEIGINQNAVNGSGQRTLGSSTTGSGIGDVQGTYLAMGSIATGYYWHRAQIKITAAGQQITPFLLQNSGANLDFRASVRVFYVSPPQ